MTDSVRAVRREGDRELPLGPKAQRTRAAILEAAAQGFATDGYQRTTMAAIAAAAGVSLGTVYQYFRDRSEVVAALVHINVNARLSGTELAWRAVEGVEGLTRVLSNFVANYAEVAALAGVWEEVTHVDPELAELRRRMARVFTGAVERELRRAARAQLVRGDLDPALAAVALTGMADRFCYVTYCFDPPDGDPPAPEAAARVLADLWAAAIGLRSAPE